MPPATAQSSQRRGIGHALLLVVVAALLVRGGAMWVLRGQLAADPDAYGALAENLAQHGVLGHGERPTAYRPPLYPLLLRATCLQNGSLSPVRVAVLHVVLGVVTTTLVWLLGCRAGLGSWSHLAAALTMLDPILLHQASLVMTETLAVCLAVTAWWLLTQADDHWGWMLAAGLTLGLAALCRPTFLAWIALLIAVRLCRRRTWGAAVLLSLAVLATLSPWMIRNAQQLGRPLPTTTHGGYTLLLGNNRNFYRHLREAPWGTVWDSRPLDSERWQWLVDHDFDELAADRDSYHRAWQAMASEPSMFLYSCLVRIGRLWTPLPHELSSDESPSRRAARWLTALWYIAIYVLVGIALAAQRGHLTAPLWRDALLLALSLLLAHTLFWSNMRMRAPLIPLLSLLAALGARRLGSPP